MKFVTGILAVLVLSAPAFAIQTVEEQFEGALETLRTAVEDEAGRLAGTTLDKSGKKVLKAFEKAGGEASETD